MSDQTARLRASVSVFSALRHPQYRRFWIGNLASVSGQQAMWVVHGWLIYELTESPIYLGYAGLAGAAPAIVLNLFGGVLADRLDQRRLIVWLQFASGAIVLALATLTILDQCRSGTSSPSRSSSAPCKRSAARHDSRSSPTFWTAEIS